MAKGDLKQHVPVRSHDELGELAAAFNQMSADLDRLNLSRRQMTADIAHDLRSPLTVIGGYVESMRDGVLKPTPERLDTIHAEVQHLQRLVEDLRTLSQADAGELRLNREPVAPLALLERMAKSYDQWRPKRKSRWKCRPKPDLPEIQSGPGPHGAGLRQPDQQFPALYPGRRPDPADGRAGKRQAGIQRAG